MKSGKARRSAARAITLLLAVLCICTASGQTDSVFTGNPNPQKKKERNLDWLKNFTYGANFQAWIGNPTFIFLSPTIGYVPFRNFNVGIGGIYSYTSFNSSVGRFSQSVFGGHSFARYIIADNYFVQMQFDRLYQPDYFSMEPQAKTWVNYLLAGGGFRQRVSDKAAVMTSVMFNLTPNPLSIYPSRVILQFGFTAGF